MKKGITNYSKKYKRFGVIITGIVLLNCFYGFDIKFTLINLFWIAINIV
jgi:hypothetical protein